MFIKGDNSLCAAKSRKAKLLRRQLEAMPELSKVKIPFIEVVPHEWCQNDGAMIDVGETHWDGGLPFCDEDCAEIYFAEQLINKTD